MPSWAEAGPSRHPKRKQRSASFESEVESQQASSSRPRRPSLTVPRSKPSNSSPPPTPHEEQIGEYWIKAWKGKHRAFDDDYALWLQGSYRQSLDKVATSLAAKLGVQKHRLRTQVERSDFNHLRILHGHTSCVNALAFSRGSGRWLASGGDDKRIHIRDVFDNLSTEGSMPIAHLHGHRSNIFSLSWSAHNKYLYSGGNDSRVLYYDLEHTPLPLRHAGLDRPKSRNPSHPGWIADHDDSIREVSSHPVNPHIVLSCCDSGELELLDIRLPQDRVASSRVATASFAGVQWNPNTSDGNTFAAATQSSINGSTRLYDIRKCFASTSEPLTHKDAVLEYATTLQQKDPCRGILSTRAETSSIVFDPTGQLLASCVSLYKPTIYAVGDPHPLAVCSTDFYHPLTGAQVRSDGSSSGQGKSAVAPAGLSSSCTIKHGSFGLESQTGKLYFATGSDDFRAYGFDIPPIEEMRARRQVSDYFDWLDVTPDDSPESSEGEDDAPWREKRRQDSREVRYVQHYPEKVAIQPMELNEPAFVLEGSQSIVNLAQFHPTLPYIATAGIERIIRMYSAIPFGKEEARPPTRLRYRVKNSAAVARALVRHNDNEDSPEPDNEGTQSFLNAMRLDPLFAPRPGNEGSDSNGDDSDSEEDDDDDTQRHDEEVEIETLSLFDELLREDEERTLFDGIDCSLKSFHPME